MAAAGRPVARRKLERDEAAAHFPGLAPCIFGREACPGGRYRARVICAFGHDLRLPPAQCLRPYVKFAKHDGEAICEAMMRPIAEREPRASLPNP